MGDLRVIMGRISSLRAAASDWASLYETLAVVAHCAELVSRVDTEGVGVLDEFRSWRQNETLTVVIQTISNTLDIDGGLALGKLRVRDGFDKALDKSRSTYAQMDRILDHYWKQFEALYSDFPAARLAYFPQLGFLVIVHFGDDKIDMEARIEAIVNEYQFEYQFHTSNCVYFKDDGSRFLDNHFGDVYHLALDREAELMRQLATFMSSFASKLRSLARLTASLDWYMSFFPWSILTRLVFLLSLTQHLITTGFALL